VNKSAKVVLVAVYKSKGIWQSKTPAEQAGNIRHLEEEHITPEVVGKTAAKAGVKTVLMTHLVATIDPNDDYQRYVDGAKRYFSEHSEKKIKRSSAPSG
jgi:ribonuclease BN (tRNA processing enzyme)